MSKRNYYYRNPIDISEALQANSKRSGEAFNKIKRIIFISVKYYDSFKEMSKLGAEICYADPQKADFVVDKDSIYIKPNEKKYKNIYITNGQYNGGYTVLFIKSGYKLDKILAFVEKIKNYKYLLIVNLPEAVNISSNKERMAAVLSMENITQPRYIISDSNDIDMEDHSKLDVKLKSIYGNNDEDNKYVCKIMSGHGGFGVFICTGKNIVQILQCIYKLKSDEHIFIQEYIESAADGDLRLYVLTVNGKTNIFNVCLRHKKPHDFRSNISQGAAIEENYHITAEQRSLAVKAAKASGLCFAGVDIIPGKDSNYVLEVNGSPGTPVPEDEDNIRKKKNIAFHRQLFLNIDNML